MDNIAPFIRIGLRILGGFLIGQGVLQEDDVWIFSDEEVIGLCTLMLSEGWYALAKWRGWAK